MTEGVFHSKVFSSDADPIRGSHFNEAHKDGRGNAPTTTSVDASNRPFGVYDFNGVAHRFGVHRAKTCLLVGDSISAISEVSLSATSVTDNGDGTATVHRTAHSLGVGDPVRIGGAVSQALNVLDNSVSQVLGVDDFVVSLGGRTHTVTAPSGPSIYYPLRRSCRGWFNWMETFLGVSFDTTWCAVGGASAADLSDLVAHTAITTEFDLICVNVGMNDAYSDGLSFADASANIKTLYDQVKPLGRHLLILTIPPRDSGNSAWTSAKQQIHTQLNRWIYEYALSIGAKVIQTAYSTQNGATYVNALASNPDPLASMVFDGVHPAMRGGMAIGWDGAQALSPFVGGDGWKVGHASDIGTNTGNILTDAAFATGSGGVATGWASSDSGTGMSVVPTLVARTVAVDRDAAGQNQVLSINYGTAGATVSTRLRKNNIHTLVTPGTWVQFVLPFSVVNALGLVGLEVNLVGARAGVTNWLVYANSQDSNNDVVTGNFSGRFITPVVYIPDVGFTDLDLWIRAFITSAQVSDLVLTIWHPELRIVTVR